MRFIYVSNKGSKPLNIGVNRAKRRARRLDKQDRAKILQFIGAGSPKGDVHHSQLVRSRHRYYHEQHEEFVRERSKAAT
jgi:hypothetical protein